MELMEDAPPSFFREFYLSVCNYYKIDPDALFLSLMEDEK